MNGYGKRNPLTLPSGVGLADPSPATGHRAVAIPGGQVEQHQHSDGTSLSQTVELRRPDGSVWTAYARRHPLPTDPAAASRATGQATSILTLLAGAVAAVDIARQARGVMLDWDGPPPAWQLRYE